MKYKGILIADYETISSCYWFMEAVVSSKDLNILNTLFNGWRKLDYISETFFTCFSSPRWHEGAKEHEEKVGAVWNTILSFVFLPAFLLFWSYYGDERKEGRKLFLNSVVALRPPFAFFSDCGSGEVGTTKETGRIRLKFKRPLLVFLFALPCALCVFAVKSGKLTFPEASKQRQVNKI